MRVASPPVRPLLIYDGECNFCRRWIARWEQSTGEHVDYVPSQDPQIAQRFPEIPQESFATSIQLIEPDGTVYSGAQAAMRALNQNHIYENVPGLAPVSEWAYRLVARHRSFFSLMTAIFWGKSVMRPSYLFSREIFIRSLGVIYLIAFISLWTQIDGLVGSHGIEPVGELMQASQGSLEHNGRAAYLLMPTVFWYSSSDAALHTVCGVGTALSICVIAGVSAGPALAVLWLLYLSLSQVCGVFLGYQWDALLLEIGFLAIWFAPWGLLPRSFRRSQPSWLVILLIRWLLFRLLFSSGVVKLASGDPLWNSLTALTVHYQTQPLPPWTAWFAHQLPQWFQKCCCVVMFTIELVIPFFVFGPRRLRLIAAAAITFLMTMISLTGNYCFFNLLTVLLCVTLVDDAVLDYLTRKLHVAHWVKRTTRDKIHWSNGRLRTLLFAPMAAVILAITLPTIPRVSQVRVHWPRWFFKFNYMANFWCWSFHSINNYGLFANMTTIRPEIIIEGSNDGQIWLPYEFKYKPGDIGRHPSFVWPHQPRLDWQMWFEALRVFNSPTQPSDWFVNFCVRLLQGQPEVLRLLGHNPFPNAPPKFIRAEVYVYTFTDLTTLRTTGQWWHREYKGDYCPALALKQ